MAAWRRLKFKKTDLMALIKEEIAGASKRKKAALDEWRKTMLSELDQIAIKIAAHKKILRMGDLTPQAASKLPNIYLTFHFYYDDNLPQLKKALDWLEKSTDVEIQLTAEEHANLVKRGRF